jgi:uncharacterized protein YjbI with pentapeptide repeats
MNIQQLLTAYAEGKRDFRFANLADAYLRRANLAGANLAGADLADANLCRANLAGADLADADLRRADLADANLADADLRRADLSSPPLVGGGTSPSALAQGLLTPKIIDNCNQLWYDRIMNEGVPE